MKRADIKVGEAYYYDRSNTWAEGGYSNPKRAVVVDDKRYRINNSTWGWREAPYSEDPKGTAVLVDLYWVEGERPSRTAVPASHLRGPWEQTKAEVEATVQRRREATNRHEVQRREAEKAARDLVAQLAALGVYAGAQYNGSVNVHPAGVANLAALLARDYASKEA